MMISDNHLLFWATLYVHVKYGLGVEFTAVKVELMPEGALKLFIVCNAYRYSVGQAIVIGVKSRSHREYLIPTDNMIVLDHFLI